MSSFCEEWRPVVGWEGEYEVSNLGRVRKVNGELLKQHRSKYLRVVLGPRKTRKFYLVHRLVAQAFIPNPDGRETVNHINGDGNDNTVTNLEWATMKEQMSHAREVLHFDNAAHLRKRVACFKPLTGEKIKEFESITEASEKLGILYTSINNCLRGGSKHAGGYVWRYL